MYLFPRPALIVIQPWEKSLLKAIEKAILTSELGINPTNNGNCIRLVFADDRGPQKRGCQGCKEKGDGAKVPCATSAGMQMTHLKRQKKQEICQRTNWQRLQRRCEKLTDKMVERVDKLVEEKTKEIMTV